MSDTTKFEGIKWLAFSVTVGVGVALCAPSKNPANCGYMTTLFLIFVAPVLPSMVTMFFVGRRQPSKTVKTKRRTSRPIMFLRPPPGHRLLAKSIQLPYGSDFSKKPLYSNKPESYGL